MQHVAWGPLAQHRIGEVLTNPVVKSIAAKYGKSPSQVALRFHLQRGIVVIPKSVNKARMKENLDILNFELTSMEINQLRNFDENKSMWAAYDDPEIVKMAMTE